MLSESNRITGDETSPVTKNCDFIKNFICPSAVISPDGKIHCLNEAFAKFFKEFYSLENFESVNLITVFQEPERESVARAFAKSFDGAFTRVKLTVSLPEGENPGIFEINLQPMGDGKMVDKVLVSIIETDHIEIADPSGESFDQSQFFEYSPVPIIRIDPDFNVLDISGSFFTVFGKKGTDSTMPDWDSIVSIFRYDGEKIRNSLSEIFMGTSSHKRFGEVKVLLKDQVNGVSNIVIYPVRKGKSVIYADMILEDFTQVRNLKGKLENFRRMNLINDVGKGFTHSINNILNVILNQTQLLQFISEKEPVISGLEQIEKYGHQAVEHIKRIQVFLGNYSETYNEKVEILETVIKDSLEFARIHFKVSENKKMSGITIKNDYDASDFKIKTDTQLLRELIIWSVLRVSSYINKDGAIRVEFTGDNKHSMIISGEKREGEISEDIIPYTIDGFSSTEIRDSAEKINLKVIENESAEHYSIEILFPQWAIFEDEEGIQHRSGTRVTGKKVMIVEDEEGLRTILANLFRRMNNMVYVTDNGSNALEEIKKHNYEILISDYDIAGITGIELAARVKELDENTITVLMSAWDINDMSLYDNIIDFFISKPFNIEDLLGIIATKIKM